MSEIDQIKAKEWSNWSLADWGKVLNDIVEVASLSEQELAARKRTEGLRRLPLKERVATILMED